MNNKLKKVELGCGKYKLEGYIGVDRYELPGVDVVCDLNGPFPFEDSSIDVIWACHSLEHLSNIEHTMNEIYRICKHGAIVQILAPYYMTSLNLANHFHLSAFNEDTMRLFSNNHTIMIDPEEYACPHVPGWGVQQSDNSDGMIEMEILKMEYFYYKEYCGLSDERKHYARRSFLNACDQIFYVMVVNKSGVPFQRQELENYLKFAKTIEPKIISEFRKRDQTNALSDSHSIYTEIDNVINDCAKLSKQYFALEKKHKELVDKNQKLEKELNGYRVQQMFLFKELAGLLETNSSQSIPLIEIKDQEFTDALILCSMVKKNQEFCYSKKIPCQGYFEYTITGNGSKIYLYAKGNENARILVEIVKNNSILNQFELTLEQTEGVISVKTDGFDGSCRIRFKALTPESYVRILEIKGKTLFKATTSLAYYLS